MGVWVQIRDWGYGLRLEAFNPSGSIVRSKLRCIRVGHQLPNLLKLLDVRVVEVPRLFFKVDMHPFSKVVPRFRVSGKYLFLGVT